MQGDKDILQFTSIRGVCYKKIKKIDAEVMVYE